MGSVVLIGAALLGGLIARAAVSPPERSQRSQSSAKAAQPSQVSPQSYVVTPVGGGSHEAAASQNASIVDAIGKFTV